MAKKKEPSEAEAPVVPTPDTPLPEATEAAVAPVAEAPAVEQEVAKPPEEAVEPTEQKEEKPDLRAQLEALPKEERTALVEEVLSERLQSMEHAAEQRAWSRIQGDQHQQIQANQQLQDTLKNLDTADDDTKRAGHVDSYATWRVQQAAQRQAQDALESVREALGLTPAEHDEAMIRVHQAAARAGGMATFGDYVKYVTGERFMPKQEVKKALRGEIDAALEERLGRQRAEEPAPVSMGPGEPPATRTPEQEWLDANCPVSGPIHDRYMEWRKSLVF